MPLHVFQKKRLKNFISGIMALAVILSLIFSCNKKTINSSDYSKGFKPVFDTVSILFETSKDNRGIRYLDSSIQHISGLTAVDRFRIYSFHFVVENKGKHNNEQALLYADSMLMSIRNLADKSVYNPLYGEASFARGDALFELGRYSEAFGSYYQGYLIGKNNLNNCTLSDYTYRMGMITYKQGNYKFSANYFKESFSLSESCKENFSTFFRQQEVLDNIALSYKNAGQLDSALFYFNKALNYINDKSALYSSRRGTLDIARAVIYGNKADVLSMQGHYDDAVIMLKKSIVTNLKKGNDNHDAQLSEIKLGELYLQLQLEEMVMPLLTQVKQQIDSVNSSDVEAGWNKLMGLYYTRKKDFEKALVYSERFHQIRDSLADKNRALKENNVIEQVGNIEKQYQIAELRNRQRIYVFTGIIFLSMLLIIILLIYRNWKRSRQEMIIVSALNTQVNKQKDDLEQTLAELNISSQEKDRILRTVAHDLRNPLGGIASLTNALIEDYTYSPEQLELLRIIKETAFDSLELINEILEVTDTMQTVLPRQPIDINMLLNNSVELMRFKAAEKNQRIVLKTLNNPEAVLISREKIWRVISNLISNAIKFSPVGADIEVTITDEHDEVQVAVHDNGIGIPEKLQSKVFNMFTDAKRPGTLGEKSFGLGLSISRQIIEKHSGKIWFETDGNKGTTFYFKLPKTSQPMVSVQAL